MCPIHKWFKHKVDIFVRYVNIANIVLFSKNSNEGYIPWGWQWGFRKAVPDLGQPGKHGIELQDKKQ